MARAYSGLTVFMAAFLQPGNGADSGRTPLNTTGTPWGIRSLAGRFEPVMEATAVLNFDPGSNPGGVAA